MSEIAQPSFEQLAAMAQEVNKSEPVTLPTEPKVAKAKEKPTEAAPVTASEKHQDEVEEPLPEGVRKRIEKETAKAARIQSEIDKAVSATKAKEQELASLRGKQGSEPVKTTEPKKDERPTAPDLQTFQGTLAEYNAAQKKYITELEAYLEGKTRASVKQEFEQRDSEQSRQRAWAEADTALAKAGTIKAGEFAPLMDALAREIPVDLQRAISALEDWSGVAVYLAKNDDERAAMVESFKTDRVRTIAKLGKLEAQLAPEARTAKPNDDEEEETLPRPAKPIGGAARQTQQQKPLHEMIAKGGDAGEFLSHVGKMLKAS